jgi:hypothetical protein
MAHVCSKCRTENADGALVCRHCGAPLPPTADWGRSLLPEDDNFDPLSAPTLVMRHTEPSTLPPLEQILLPSTEPARRRRGLLPGVAALVLMAAAGLWLLWRGEPAPSTPAPAPAAPATAASRPSAAPPAPSAPAIAAAPPAASAPEPPSSSAAPAAAAGALPPAAAPAPEQRKRLPEPVSRQRAQQAALPASPAAQAVVEQPTPAPASAPAAQPERAKTVAELCAGLNLLARGFCEQRECQRAELAGDPACVKLREAEQRRLFQQ